MVKRRAIDERVGSWQSGQSEFSLTSQLNSLNLGVIPRRITLSALSMSTVVRRATPSDADRIAEIAASVQVLHATALPSIFQANAREAFPVALIHDLLARPGHHVWLAQAGETPSGYLYAELQRRPATLVKHPVDRLYIHQMGVLPPARRHGLGSALLAAAREFAREAGIAQLALDVWAFNSDAREFYERHGFGVMRQELWSAVDAGRI